MGPPAAGGRTVIFISHTDRAEADRRFTTRLIEALRDRQIPYWVDREHPLEPEDAVAADLGPGPENPVFMRLCEAIAQAELLLYILSPKSISREFVRLEFDPRVILGPGAGVATAVIALSPYDEIAPELAVVLGAIAEPRVWEPQSLAFDVFIDELEAYWRSLPPAPPRSDWRRQSNFQARDPPPPPSQAERRRDAAEGRKHLRRGLELIRARDLDRAEESIADAYMALHSAGDARGTVEALYATFEVGFLLGIRALHTEPEAPLFDGLPGNRLQAQRLIGHALEALEEAARQADALGEHAIGATMRRRLESIAREPQQGGADPPAS